MYHYHFAWTLCLAIIHSCLASIEIGDKFTNPMSSRIDENGRTMCSGTNNYNNRKWILNNHPGKYRFPHAVMQDHDHWWFEEIAASNKCYDLSRKVLLITYRAETTGPRQIRYHQKLDHTCTSVDSTTHSAQIMFYHDNEQLIVPLSSFVGADLTLGYGFTFYGPLDIMEIALVDIGETYQAHVPTTDIVHVADYPSTVTALLSITAFTLKYHQSVVVYFPHLEVNMTGEMIKIVYSCDFSGLRRLYLVQQGKSIPAYILFNEGTHNYALVPFSFFLGADPNLSVAMFVLRGPLTVHRIELVASQHIMPLPISQSLTVSDSPHVVSLSKPYPILSDITFESLIILNAFDDMLLMGFNKVGGESKHSDNVQFLFQQVILPSSDDSITEYFSTTNDQINDADAIQIIYTAPKTQECQVSMLFTDGIQERTIIFHEGGRNQIVISIQAYGDIKHVLGTTIHGPLTIHQIDLAKTLPVQPSRTNFLISHESVLDDFLTQINFNDLRKQISVTFTNNAESNFCEKNVRLFYTHLSHALSRPAGFLRGADKTFKIFPIKYKDDSSKPLAVKEIDHYLDSIGRFVGSSILHGHLLDLTFSHEIYMSILAWYGTYNAEVSMELFSFECPQRVNGERMYITGPRDPNWPHLEKLSREELAYQVRRNIDIFVQGIHRIVPYRFLEDMNVLELKALMHGTWDIDLEEWKKYTVLEGYVQDDITIGLFWMVLAEWDKVLKSKLLYFVTGSPRASGLMSFITIRKMDDQSVLPSSDKCGNILNLPAYTDLDTMRNRLKDALKDALPTAI